MKCRIRHHLTMLLLVAVLLVAPMSSYADRPLETPTAETFELTEATISEIQAAMERGILTAEELVLQYLKRIEAYDQQGPSINSIITINENAVEIARELDKERAQHGPRSPLHGIPIVLKDNFDTADMPTSAGCVCLKDSIPPDDAHQVQKLKEAGAIILAKTNLHEFAFGITTESSLGGQTLNPYNLAHNPGGSSGGTGAAVAANFATAGFGTDTGGSIRIPSAFNSLVGLRPTIGLSSRDGIIPLALTQDTGGPMARTVEDIAYLLDATVGYDEKDIETARSVTNIPETYTEFLTEDGLEGAKIGVVRSLFNESSHEVNDIIERAIEDVEQLGAEVVEVEIPFLDEIFSYPSLSNWEFKFQLNDYLEALGEGAPYASLDEIIQSGEYSKSIERSLIERNERETLDTEEYKDIVLFRTKVAQHGVLKAMADNELDALMYPTSTNAAAEIGRGQRVGNNNRLSAFSGFPAITVPAGYTTDGLPVGVEFLARAFDEPTLMKIAYAYEQKTQHRKPPEFLQDSEVDKYELQIRVNEIKAEQLNEYLYTVESWKNLQYALTEAENVLNDPNATQTEVDGALSRLNEARDGLEEIDIRAESMKTWVDRLAEEEELSNDEGVRSLMAHLTAISYYENLGIAEKVIKHLESFKGLLKHQKDVGMMSDKAFDILHTQVNRMIEKWEANRNSNVLFPGKGILEAAS